MEPNLLRYNLWMVYPYIMRGADQESTSTAALQGSLPPGWQAQAPESLAAHNLGRWFYREVRTLFLPDTAGPGPGGGQECPLTPKFRWIKLVELPGWFKGDELGNWRVALARPARRSDRKLEAITLDQQPAGETPCSRAVLTRIWGQPSVSVFGLLSTAGALLLVVRLEVKNPFELRAAMLLNHHAGHADGGDISVTLVPHVLASRISSCTSGDARPEPVLLDEAAAATCLSLSTPPDEMRRAPLRLNSMPHLLTAPLFERLDCTRDSYLAAGGRLPVASSMLLSHREGQAEDRQLEWLCARFHRHPDDSRIIPVPEELDSQEDQLTVHVTGSQRFHVSSEGMLAFGHGATDFDRSTWTSRVANEYLATWLIAQHQNLLLQDLSWRSYTQRTARGGRRTAERLLRQYRVFSTDFNFEAVSPQLNVQRLYSASRSAMHIARVAELVRGEVMEWLSIEERSEQRALNSLAVLALLFGLATLFTGIGLTHFNADAKLDPLVLTGSGDTVSGLWLWIPLALVLVLIGVVPKLRSHVVNALRYVSGRTNRSGD